MQHNNLKAGMRVKLTPLPFISRQPRYASIVDNKKGIIRMIHVETRDGYYGDMGSTYVDEIREVDVDGAWVPVEISPAHAKQMQRVHASGF